MLEIGLVDTTDAARTLRLVFEGLTAHRETAMNTLASEYRVASGNFASLASDVKLAVEKGERYDIGFHLSMAEAHLNRIKELSIAIKEGEVTIGNIESLSRGTLRFFGKAPAVKKTTNVSQLPTHVRNDTPLSQRGKTSTGSNEGRANPGRERQRQRKDSPNNE